MRFDTRPFSFTKAESASMMFSGGSAGVASGLPNGFNDIENMGWRDFVIKVVPRSVSTIGRRSRSSGRSWLSATHWRPIRAAGRPSPASAPKRSISSSSDGASVGFPPSPGRLLSRSLYRCPWSPGDSYRQGPGVVRPQSGRPWLHRVQRGRVFHPPQTGTSIRRGHTLDASSPSLHPARRQARQIVPFPDSWTDHQASSLRRYISMSLRFRALRITSRCPYGYHLATNRPQTPHPRPPSFQATKYWLALWPNTGPN